MKFRLITWRLCLVRHPPSGCSMFLTFLTFEIWEIWHFSCYNTQYRAIICCEKMLNISIESQFDGNYGVKMRFITFEIKIYKLYYQIRKLLKWVRVMGIERKEWMSSNGNLSFSDQSPSLRQMRQQGQRPRKVLIPWPPRQNRCRLTTKSVIK